MAINGINSSSTLRLSGLVSGMDTDTLIKQLMTAEKAKMNKVIQKREIDLWKTEAYRDITSTLKSFYNDYFDTLSSKNLKSASNFTGYSATYGASNSTNYVSVSAGASAKAGTYTITSMKAATAAKTTGISASMPIEGKDISDASVASINTSNGNNKFVITLNNVTREITLNDTTVNSTVEGLSVELQNKLDQLFGKDRITVNYTSNAANDGGKIGFSVKDTDALSIGTAYNSGASTIFDVEPGKAPFVTTKSNNKFELTLGSGTGAVTHTIELEPGQVYTSAADLAAAIQSKADAKFGPDKISFTEKDGKVVYTSGSYVSIGKSDSGTNAALGLSNSSLSNKIDLNAKIFSIKDALPNSSSLTVTGTEEDIMFTINGKYFRFNSKYTSFNDIMKTVNADTTINAKMKYDSTTNSFSIESTITGASNQLKVTDESGGLLSAIGFNVTDTLSGTDSSIKIKGINGSSSEIEITRPNNSFSYDGLTFNIKEDFTASGDIEPIKVTITDDTSKTYDFIKGFVDKYNEIIEKLNSKVNEKVYRDYAPLTDEQKEAMKEDDIKKWEEKAKSGLLKNDSIISNTLSQMRSALYSVVEGSGINLSSIGITTSTDYTQKGKLVIDETKLKAALANNPEEVAALFTSSSDITYYDAMNSAALRSQRNKESGIAHKLSDIIQDAIRTNTDSNGNKGTLLEKAGMVGDRSEYSNILYKEIMEFDSLITEMNKKLIQKENALYAKFTSMESALSKLNDQQSWLTQQLQSYN